MELKSNRFNSWTSEQDVPADFLGPVALTIGNFDGIHVGHQALLAKITQKSEELSIKCKTKSLVMSFDPHPAQVLFPEKRHCRLFSRRDQREQIQSRGVEGLYVQTFSRSFSGMSAEEFMSKFLVQDFQVQFLVVGHDFSFAKHRSGTHEKLKDFCDLHGIQFEVLPPVTMQGQIVSTSRIREALKLGDLAFANAALGRPFVLSGVVEKGAQRGRLLGYPTANLRAENDFVPTPGVYVSSSTVAGKDYRTITFIGVNKTFVEGDLSPVKIETHILDFSADIYGQRLEVRLLDFLRSEQKFSSVEALKEQIQLDVSRARGFF